MRLVAFARSELSRPGVTALRALALVGAGLAAVAVTGASSSPIEAAAPSSTRLGQATEGWSRDPATNTVIADRPGEQVQPKLAPTADGGLYVSWYDNYSGGYDVSLQRVAADGTPCWTRNGILVADRGFSWTTDYGLAADKEGNALVVFRDDRSGQTEITIEKVAPNGDKAWGPTGVQMPAASSEVYAPSVAVASDGFVWVAWTDGRSVRALRLDASGNAALPEAVTVTDPEGAQLSVSDIQPSDDGGIVISWVRQLDMRSPRHLYAQSYSAIGEPEWGELGDVPGSRHPVTLFDTGSLQMGNFPDFVADGAGGAVFAWYEVEPKRVHVQWLRSDGVPVFESGGIVAATAAHGEQHVEPSLAFNRGTEEIYVVWRLTYDSGPEYRMGLMAQKLTLEGRQWGSEGLAFESPGPLERTQLTALPIANGVLFAYVEALAYGNQRIWLRRLDRQGHDVWDPIRVAVSESQSGKSRLAATWSSLGFAVYAWQDGRGGEGESDDIYIQNIGPNGELAPVASRYSLFLPRLAVTRS